MRRAIAVAGQDSHLFSTTIRDNLRLARPYASDAEVEDALRRARIWDWISGSRTASTRSSARPGASCPAANGSASS